MFVFIPGRKGNGIPLTKKVNSNPLQPLHERQVPSVDYAVSLYEDQGGQLQRNWIVGHDLLGEDECRKERRRRLFQERYCFDNIFTSVFTTPLTKIWMIE